jgi:hypothetical protein
MTNENMGSLAAEAKTSEVAKEAKTPNINNPIKVAAKPVLNEAQLKEAAEQMAALAPDDSFRLNKPTPLTTDNIDLNSLDPYGQTEKQFADEVEAEERQAAEVLHQANESQIKVSGKTIRDLIEDDAYNLEVPLYAGVAFNPNLLRVEMRDPSYVARWGNTNNIRQTMLVSQGFTFCSEKDVLNFEQLHMFVDSLGHFVWADLVAMKIPKNIYYAGLRRSYLKSLHATNKTKAAQAGAAFAKSDLGRTLTGAEKTYLANQTAKLDKEIYTPVVGV